MKITVDVHEIRDLQNKFQLFAQRAYPFATKAALNQTAFLARAAARQNIRKEFTLRNHWTLKGVKVERARTLNVNNQVALVGSVDDYMARQEFGGVLRAKPGKDSKPIYTAISAGLPKNTSPVSKLPVKRHRLGPRGKLKLDTSPARAKSKKQRAIIKIKQAQKAGLKHAYLELPSATGLFAILGRGKKKRIELVHDLSRKSVRTPPSPWLAPAVARVQPLMPRIWRDALIAQARRHRLFGY